MGCNYFLGEPIRVAKEDDLALRVSRCAAWICFPLYTWSQTLTTNQTLNVNLQPAGQIVSVSGGTFTPPVTPFGTFTSTVTITSRVRTSPSGSGSLTEQFNSDFAGSGPKIANGDLKLQCSASGYGTACSGTVTPSLGVAATLNSFAASSCTGGGGGCSASDPNSLTVQFSIADKVTFKTGTFTVSGTVTISTL